MFVKAHVIIDSVLCTCINRQLQGSRTCFWFVVFDLARLSHDDMAAGLHLLLSLYVALTERGRAYEVCLFISLSSYGDIICCYCCIISEVHRILRFVSRIICTNLYIYIVVYSSIYNRQNTFYSATQPTAAVTMRDMWDERILVCVLAYSNTLQKASSTTTTTTTTAAVLGHVGTRRDTYFVLVLYSSTAVQQWPCQRSSWPTMMFNPHIIPHDRHVTTYRSVLIPRI